VGAIWSVANQTNGTDAASFAIAATANSSGGVNGNYTTYSVSLMWNSTSSTINKASNFDTASQGFSNSVTLYNAVAFSSVTASSAKSSFVSIQTTSDGNIFNQGGTDTADAWLSFGVTFAAINNNVASTPPPQSGVSLRSRVQAILPPRSTDSMPWARTATSTCRI
jgi:hypothetical protein